MRLFLLLLLSCSLHAQNVVRKYNGINFLLHSPAFNATRQPLIIFLHGVGEKGGTDTSLIRLVERNGVPRITKTTDITEKQLGIDYNFYVIAPQLLNTFSSWPSSYVKDMIAYAKRNLSIDTNRIYVVGLSLGGGGVWTSVQDESVAKDVAAVAVMCGTAMLKSASLLLKYKIESRMYHCEDDNIVAVNSSDNAAVLLRNAGATVDYTRYATGGHSGGWTNGTNQVHQSYKLANGTWYIQSPNVFEWLLKYTR